MKVLLKVLSDRHNGHFNVKWPDAAGMRMSNDSLVKNQPHAVLTHGVFGVGGGGILRCADHGDADLQKPYYEGCTCDLEITILLLFNFFGN